MIKSNTDEVYNYNNNNEESNKIDFNKERKRIYFQRRRELKSLITAINTHINYTSQSLFLALYFMDTIFTSSDLEKVFYSHFDFKNALISLFDIQMNNYALLSVACLIIAYKFNENDLHFPTITYFTKLLNQFSKNSIYFNVNDLSIAEVIVIKLLKYKLNYYTIYNYLIFFFCHGIILRKTLQKSELYTKLSEKKILEKIYILSREIIDKIIDSEEYYNYYYGKDNYILSLEVLLWVTENILGIKIPNNENIFKLIFNININEIKHRNIIDIIEKVNMSKTINIENINKPIFLNNNFYKKLSYDNINSFSTIYQSNKSNYTINSIQSKNRNITTSYNNYISSQIYNDNYNFQKEAVNNDSHRFNSNYLYHSERPDLQMSINTQRDINNYSTNESPHNSINTKIKNINISSNYNINSTKLPLNNSSKRQAHTIKNNETKSKKEPLDNEKNKKDRNNNNNIIIDENRNKMIFFDVTKIKKKSLSCNKKGNKSIENKTINNNFINENNLDINFMDTKEDELKNEEKINKPKIFNNRLYINKCKLSVSQPKQIKINNVINYDSQTLFKGNNNSIKYSKSKDLNKINIENNKISTEELIKKTKNLFKDSKLNQFTKNEPQDNIKRIKFYRNNRIDNDIIFINDVKNNINKSAQNKVNKNNIIIINNNIHINTYIDSKNCYKNNKINQKYSYNNNNNKYIFNNNNQNINSEIMTFPNLKKIKIIKSKRKFIYDLKNSQNIMNKSNNYLIKDINSINGDDFNICH